MLNDRKIYMITVGEWEEFRILCAYDNIKTAEEACIYLKGMKPIEYGNARIEEYTIADNLNYLETFRN